MNSEVEKYFLEYLQIKNHFRDENFWYGEKKVNIKNAKKYQYNIIKSFSRQMSMKTFRRYLTINFFFNEKFNIYDKKIDDSYLNSYFMYQNNPAYYYKQDIGFIKKNGIKITYDILYNYWKEKKIFFFSIIEIYKKFEKQLKFESKQDKLKLDKYIYLEEKIKENK